MQKPNSPSEPHDALFRALTGDSLSSESLIRRFGPPELVRVLSGKPPRLLDGTLVRPELRKFHVDALFQVEVRGGDSVFVQILYEHLSSPSPGTPLRLLEYMAAAWRQRDSNIGLRTLHPIIPVVICHGPRRRVVPESFMELIDVPEALAGKLPLLDLGIEIHDLGGIPDPELADDPATRGALRAMKLTHVKDPPIATLLEIVQELATRPGDSLVRKAAVVYLLRVLGLSDEHYVALMNAQDQGVRDIGVQDRSGKAGVERQGRGREEGQADLILMQLEERFGPVPADVVERVRTAGTAQLEAWSKSLLYARDLHGVFGSCADH